MFSSTSGPERLLEIGIVIYISFRPFKVMHNTYNSHLYNLYRVDRRVS